MIGNVIAYESTQLTLTTAGTAYNLGTLLKAAGFGADAAITARELNIQIDDSVAGYIRLGGPDVTTAIGRKIASGDSWTYRSTVSDIPVGMMWVVPSANAMKIQVEVLN